jgi:hypothetical protein
MLAAEIRLLPAGDCNRQSKSKTKMKTKTGVQAEGDYRLELLTLNAREEAEYFDCLALCLLYGLENIGSVYPDMSMIVIGHSLLY